VSEGLLFVLLRIELTSEASPEGVTLSCKNCTLEGSVEISQGSFNLGSTDDGDNSIVAAIQDTIGFFQNGSLQVTVNDLFAHIELAAKFDLSERPVEFSVPLPAIPFTPFAVSLPVF
jgi:hypothetical protein